MNRFLTVMVLAIAAWAQAPDTQRKVIDVKHISGDRAERAMKLINVFLHPMGSISFDPVLRTAVLVAPEKLMPGAEALLAKFDSPGGVRPDTQLDFRIYLVEASPDAAMAGTVPSEIASAVEQMKKTLSFKSYRLLDTIPLRSRSSNNGEAVGVLPGTSDKPRSPYRMSFRQASVLEDGKTVAIQQFEFELNTPALNYEGKPSFARSSMKTDLSLQEGQKLVVGKLSAEGVNAIFLILTVDVQ